MQAETRKTHAATTDPQHLLPAPPNADGNSNGQSNGRHDDGRGNGGGDGHDGIPVDLPEVSLTAAVVIGVAVLVLLGALFLIGFVPHNKRQSEAKREGDAMKDAKPVVDVVQPKRSDPIVNLLLPADVQPLQATSIYARTNGYLKPLPPGIDIGAKVKAGQLLAEISSPEVDADLEQAKASLQQANVNVGRSTNEYALRKATYERFTGLSQTGGITAQQLDEKKADYNIAQSSLKAAQASVAAAQASVQRLTDLQGFEKVVAPFDGVVTERNYDAGALISASTSGAAAGVKPLLRVEQSDTLRVFANVPQTYSTEVKPGQDADLLVREYPGKAFAGKLARTSSAIDPATRTMRVEVDVPNQDQQLFRGMYCQVRFKVRQDKPPVVVPTSAFVIGADGVKVAVVDGASKVHLQKVTIGRDFGADAEIVDGLKGDERIVTNPGERLAEGVEVNVVAPKDAAKPGAQASAR